MQMNFLYSARSVGKLDIWNSCTNKTYIYFTSLLRCNIETQLNTMINGEVIDDWRMDARNTNLILTCDVSIKHIKAGSGQWPHNGCLWNPIGRRTSSSWISQIWSPVDQLQSNAIQSPRVAIRVADLSMPKRFQYGNPGRSSVASASMWMNYSHRLQSVVAHNERRHLWEMNAGLNCLFVSGFNLVRCSCRFSSGANMKSDF